MTAYDSRADFSAQRVAVCGDLIADQYIYASPQRLSREAPVMVLRHEHEMLGAGGAANVARNLAALGARGLLRLPAGCLLLKGGGGQRHRHGDSLHEVRGELSRHCSHDEAGRRRDDGLGDRDWQDQAGGNSLRYVIACLGEEYLLE